MTSIIMAAFEHCGAGFSDDHIWPTPSVMTILPMTPGFLSALAPRVVMITPIRNMRSFDFFFGRVGAPPLSDTVQFAQSLTISMDAKPRVLSQIAARLASSGSPCPLLVRVTLSHTSADDNCVAAIAAHLPRLRELDLFRCAHVTNNGIEALARHGVRLHKLRVGGVGGVGGFYRLKLNGELVTHLVHMGSTLRELSLSYISGLTDAHLRTIGDELLSLERLDLIGCGDVTDAGVAAISGLAVLQHLDIAHSAIVTDAMIVHLSTGAAALSLRHLSIVGCKRITDAGVRLCGGVVAFPRLEKLELRWCQCVTTRVVDELQAASGAKLKVILMGQLS